MLRVMLQLPVTYRRERTIKDTTMLLKMSKHTKPNILKSYYHNKTTEYHTSKSTLSSHDKLAVRPDNTRIKNNVLMIARMQYTHSENFQKCFSQKNFKKS